MKLLFKGLLPLLLSLFTLYAEEQNFVLLDEVVKNKAFHDEINLLGNDLYNSTGISLYLVMKRELEDNITLAEYEKMLIGDLREPSVVLAFVELNKKVDIIARPQSLYKDFDKTQILSPNASFAGALMSAVLFGRSFSQIGELLTNYGGVILPLLAQKAKGDDIVKKYSVAMYNGYAEISEQLAKSKNVELAHAVGNENKNIINFLAYGFYAFILYAIIRFLYVRVIRKE